MLTPRDQYVTHSPLTANQVLEKAASIIAEQCTDKEAFCNPAATKDYLKFKLSCKEREIFAVMFLDSQHQLLDYQELFFGTVDGASVYPREVVKAALKVNAAAVILAHNHPSGIAEPSQADKHITEQLVSALKLIDIRVLDHVIVGNSSVSFAELGLI